MTRRPIFSENLKCHIVSLSSIFLCGQHILELRLNAWTTIQKNLPSKLYFITVRSYRSYLNSLCGWNEMPFPFLITFKHFSLHCDNNSTKSTSRKQKHTEAAVLTWYLRFGYPHRITNCILFSTGKLSAECEARDSCSVYRMYLERTRTISRIPYGGAASGHPPAFVRTQMKTNRMVAQGQCQCMFWVAQSLIWQIILGLC